MKMKTIRRCRLCACEEDLDTFCNIFGGNPAMNIEMKINKLLPIVVMPWDPMPHTICHSCVDKLNSFDEFYEASVKAERFLRTLHPSAPEKRIGSFDPVVEVLEPPVLKQVPIERRTLPPPAPLRLEGPQRPEELPSPTWDARIQNSFIINELTSRDSIFTCRKCFRTFTKQSSALTHTCVRLEDCQEFRALSVKVGASEGPEKLLPPLKIRLFSMESNLFICELCQSPFDKKTELVAHIKRHLLEGSWSEEKREKGEGRRVTKNKSREQVGEGEKKNKEKEKKKEKRKEEREEDEKEEKEGEDYMEGVRKRVTKATRAARKRKKKCEGSGRRIRRPRKGEGGDECRKEICDTCNGPLSLGSAVKEMVESTTQYSDFVTSSEDEIEIKYEKVQKMSEETPKDEEKDGDKSNVAGDCSKTKEKEKEKAEEIQGGGEEIQKIQNLVERKTQVNSVVVIEDDNVPQRGAADRSEDVTVVQVISNRAATSFSSCVICDKIFATKNALIAHQEKHLQSCSRVKFEEHAEALAELFLCNICAMTFSSRKTLVEHEQYHLVDVETIG